MTEKDGSYSLGEAGSRFASGRPHRPRRPQEDAEAEPEAASAAAAEDGTAAQAAAAQAPQAAAPAAASPAPAIGQDQDGPGSLQMGTFDTQTPDGRRVRVHRNVRLGPSGSSPAAGPAAPGGGQADR
jgi:hypothetical protein